MPDNVIRVLLVEDDSNMSFILKSSLEQIIGGYHVSVACDGRQGLEMWRKENFDIIVSDVEMPEMDGNSMVREMKALNESLPVILITAKTDANDVIAGYNSGADMYIKKPFLPQELDAHIQALIRRQRTLGEPKAQETRQYVGIGKYKLYRNSLELQFENDSPIRLTATEARVLEMLYDNKDEIVSRKDILKKVWGNDDFYTSRSLDVFISKLRKYFSSDPDISINVVKGIGIQLKIK